MFNQISYWNGKATIQTALQSITFNAFITYIKDEAYHVIPYRS